MKLQTKSGVEGVCLGLAQLKGGHEELGNHSKAVIGDNPDAPFLTLLFVLVVKGNKGNTSVSHLHRSTPVVTRVARFGLLDFHEYALKFFILRI